MLRKQGIVHDIVKIAETIYGNISDKVVSFLDEKRMRSFFSVCLCIFLLFGRVAHAVDQQKMRSTELKNGMKVYVIQNNSLPIVMHMLIYKVGGVDDPPGLSGIAHYFEHMMFSGTKKFPKFSDVIDGLGGDLNAETSSSYTAYHELVHKKHLPLMMEMEADRMQSLRLVDKYLERERNVVREERKMRVESTKQALLAEEVFNVFYRNGYGRPVIGWDHEISNYNKEAANAFYRKYYNPNNAILLVVGDVDFGEVVRLANQHYGKIKNRHGRIEKKFATNIEPPHRSEIIVKMSHHTISDPEVMMLYKAPSVNTESDNKVLLAAHIAVDIVAGDAFGVLYNELVKNRSLATSVFGEYSELVGSDGVVSVELLPKLGVSPEDINREAKEVIADLMERGVTEELVNSAKYRSMAHFTYGLDGVVSMARFYADALAAGAEPLASEDVLKTIKSITVEDVNSVLRRIFSEASVTAYLTGDEHDGDDEYDEEMLGSQDISQPEEGFDIATEFPREDEAMWSPDDESIVSVAEA
ncbi:M16 family metallopeptidase [Anaplasma phagocytophilum]|uniref:Peptidase M16 inactive domain protein n=2 Tax=Anaplasma phagocytophilum TaxID=948 RepID=A0A0F3PP52_ANAPH|nr:pitrilysin family protein [Anaplasma phagocytophilum]EOA62615.1 M16 family peptidase [Anaplasma phagocytophilum str. CRT38]KJV82115.1 peptidase M16 inactive domain protein [Anaplasma phagocytophilum str. CRT53-1]